LENAQLDSIANYLQPTELIAKYEEQQGEVDKIVDPPLTVNENDPKTVATEQVVGL